MIHKAILRIFKIYQENIDDGVQLCKPANLTKLELAVVGFLGISWMFSEQIFLRATLQVVPVKTKFVKTCKIFLKCLCQQQNLQAKLIEMSNNGWL